MRLLKIFLFQNGERICIWALSFEIIKFQPLIYILSRASEAGSPTNRLGSGQQRDTDQGPFRSSPPVYGLKGLWTKGFTDPVSSRLGGLAV